MPHPILPPRASLRRGAVQLFITGVGHGLWIAGIRRMAADDDFHRGGDYHFKRALYFSSGAVGSKGESCGLSFGFLYQNYAWQPFEMAIAGHKLGTVLKCRRINDGISSR